MNISTAERFARRVDRRGPDECWPWTGGHVRGYGAFYLDGNQQGAHRIAVVLDGREVPDDHHVHHRCKNPDCVNPAHLEVVTPTGHGVEHRQQLCKRGHDLTLHGWMKRDAKTGHSKGRVCRECNRLAKIARRARGLPN